MPLISFRSFHSVVACSALVGAMGVVACGGTVETMDAPGTTAPEATGGSASSTGGNTASSGGSESSGNEASSGGRTSSSGGSTDADGGRSGEAGSSSEVCDGDGDVKLAVQGSTPEAWQGRAVYVSAIENTQTEGISAHRVALLSSAVEGGAFAFSCPAALHENYWYPSIAVFVDVDGDGACTSADSGYQLQLYGWGVKVAVDVGVEDWAAPDSLSAPLGNEASTFCAGYFSDLGDG